MKEYLRKTVERASDWAREAGEIQLRHWRGGESLGISTKYNDYDIVTVADKESENLIKSRIKEFYPDHDILSEETGEEGKKSDWRWVVDPLDGTTSYSQGLPVFSVSIALEYKGESVAGVVYIPRLDELFTAIKGEGAFLNGKRIHCSGKTDLRHAVVATGMPVDKKENPDNNLDLISRIVTDVRGIRRLGSAAVDLCYTAAGFFDAYWEPALHRWDIAAGRLVAAEAGAVVEFYRDDRPYSILACAPGIYQEFKEFFNRS